jgi:membrane-bound inhibitor of C-type lysozyme
MTPVLFISAFLLAGGGPGDDHIYVCDGTDIVRTQFEDGYMHLRLGGDSMILLRAISGSGARYTDGRTVFWIKGRAATLDDGNGRVRKCRVTDRG